jgi:hypothetical protein
MALCESLLTIRKGIHLSKSFPTLGCWCCQGTKAGKNAGNGLNRPFGDCKRLLRKGDCLPEDSDRLLDDCIHLVDDRSLLFNESDRLLGD